MELDLSQVELARRSGYSERVIRKAEAGGKLRAETILDLADTMSGNGRVISFAESWKSEANLHGLRRSCGR